jgi:hypothetical protein
LHDVVDERAEAISQAYHRKPGVLRIKLLAGRERQLWKPLFAICEILIPERLEELERCAIYLTGIKTRPKRSVREMHKLKAENEATENSHHLVLDAATVVRDVKDDYIRTTDLIVGLLALTPWWESYQFTDSQGKGIGIGDGESGMMMLSKILKQVTGKIISGPATRTVAGQSIRGYVVAEIREAAQALKQQGPG